MRKGWCLVGMICGIAVVILSTISIFHIWGLSQNRVGPVGSLKLDVSRLLLSVFLLLLGTAQTVVFYIGYKREK